MKNRQAIWLTSLFGLLSLYLFSPQSVSANQNSIFNLNFFNQPLKVSIINASTNLEQQTASNFSLSSNYTDQTLSTPYQSAQITASPSPELPVVAGPLKPYGPTVDELIIEINPDPTPSSKIEIVKPSPSAHPTTIPSPTPVVSTTPANTHESTSNPADTDTTAPIASSTPSPTPNSSTNGLNADKIFNLVNEYRASKGLTVLEKHDRVCQLAQSRAPEIAAEIAEGHMHSGLKSRNLDYWNSENIITMRTEEEAVRWWINDYIHRVQMEADNKYSCVACSGNACAQEFTSFKPK